jgi:hypothetical protein
MRSDVLGLRSYVWPDYIIVKFGNDFFRILENKFFTFFARGDGGERMKQSQIKIYSPEICRTLQIEIFKAFCFKPQY